MKEEFKQVQKNITEVVLEATIIESFIPNESSNEEPKIVIKICVSGIFYNLCVTKQYINALFIVYDLKPNQIILENIITYIVGFFSEKIARCDIKEKIYGCIYKNLLKASIEKMIKKSIDDFANNRPLNPAISDFEYEFIMKLISQEPRAED